MTHGKRTVQEFYSSKEPIEDHHAFKFCYLANNIKDDNKAQRIERNHKKVLFIILVGQAMFAKLTDLASPCVIADLLLVNNMELLKTHY